MQKKMNLGIEFLRFVFTVGVLVHHAFAYFFDRKIFRTFPFRAGWLGVEFFLIVGGFLLASHILKRAETGAEAQTTTKYMLRRLKMLYPPHWLCLAIMFAQHCFYKSLGIGEIVSDLFLSVPEVFLVQMGGMQPIRINNNDWYLSAMLLCSLFIYPLLRKMKTSYSRVLAPLFCFFIYGVLYQTTGSLTPTNVMVGPFFKGTLRAFAGMNLGVFSYEICRALDKTELDKLKTALVRAAEVVIYAAVLVTISMNFGAEVFFGVTMLLALAVSITFSRYSVFGLIFRNSESAVSRIVLTLGRASLYIFIFQRVILEIVWHTPLKPHYWRASAVFCAGALVLGFAMYWLFEYGPGKVKKAG